MRHMIERALSATLRTPRRPGPAATRRAFTPIRGCRPRPVNRGEGGGEFRKAWAAFSGTKADFITDLQSEMRVHMARQ